MKNSVKSKSASDAAILKFLREQAGLKYQARFAEMKAKAALEVARGLRLTIGEEGQNDEDLAAWALHVYERLSPAGGLEAEALQREGASAGSDIAAGAFAIQQASRESGDHTFLGLDAYAVGYMLRTRGVHERDGADLLRRIEVQANRMNVVLGMNNMLNVAADMDRRNQHGGEAWNARKAREEVAREAQERQEAEEEAQRAEERRLRSLTASAPKQDWRTLIETEDGEEGTETEEHLRHTGTIRGSTLETDKEFTHAVARALAKAGMASAAKKVRTAGSPPSAREIYSLAEEAFERSKDSRIRGELHRLAQGLSSDEHSRERGHAWVGARDIETGSFEQTRQEILDEAYQISSPFISPYTRDSMMQHRTSRSIDHVAHEVLDTGPKRQSKARDERIMAQSKLLALVERMERLEEEEKLTPEILDRVQHQRIASRSRLIELNPPKSPEERAIEREMDDLDREKRRLFYEERDKVPVPESGWYDEEYTKGVTKKIRPLTDPIDAQLRTLRAQKKAIREAEKVAKEARKRAPSGPARGPEIRQGRCQKCDIRYKWVERPDVKTGTSGPNQWWRGISCPKCGGTLWRTATTRGIYLGDYVDLDAPGGGK